AKTLHYLFINLQKRDDMSILQHTGNIVPNEIQNEALLKVEEFLNNGDQVFILKGYAGTGKTTLIHIISKYLGELQKRTSVAAPTGRAAKILRDNLRAGQTIHRTIYNFDRLEAKEVNSDDMAKKSFHYYFPVLDAEVMDRVMIVDEASMVSNVSHRHELFSFGSGKLLNDLITHLNFPKREPKLILVGDPAQLPPVTDKKSLALSLNFFNEQNLNASEFELNKVIRQEENSPILENANVIRILLSMDRKQRSSFEIHTDNANLIELSSDKLIETYTNNFPLPEIGNGVIITYSNAQSLNYNLAIRERIFPDNPGIAPGDIVVINNNNYHTYGYEILNGDMAKVIEVSNDTESLSAPVYVTEGNSKIKKNINLTYRDVKIKFPDIDEPIDCKIVDSLLNSPERDLSTDQMKSQYINFVMRFKNNNPGEKEGSEYFKQQLKADRYFNALRIKYGYSITCHKAQGGEWNTVFVDFAGRIGLDDDKLRWSYTALTRAKRKLYIINGPKINPINSMKFSEITKIGKAPNNFYPQNPSAYPTPFHDSDSNIAKRKKYHEITSALKDKPYSLISIDSKPYLEIYYFTYGGEKIRIDMQHDGAGLFKEFVIDDDNSPKNQLKKIIQEEPSKPVALNYQPSNDNFKELFSTVSMAIDEVGATLINVIELPDQNFVQYYLKTSGKFSVIQFYFKSNGRFSSVLPKSNIGKGDEILKKLIHKISEYVIS
ncbi:MAG: AAA family ATPase, partial [Bacteroidota bacterium]